MVDQALKEQVASDLLTTWDRIGSEYLSMDDTMTGRQIQYVVPDYLDDKEFERWMDLSDAEQREVLDVAFPPSSIYSY